MKEKDGGKFMKTNQKIMVGSPFVIHQILILI